MLAYIYLITNLVNKKQYVGYTSKTPEIRFQEHWRCRYSDDIYLHRAMIKYGKSNFIIETLEEIDESEWQLKEQYWIDKMNTLTPNGYNINVGGNAPPVHYGEYNVKSKIPNEQLLLLIEDLKSYKLRFSQIATKYGLSQSQVERINMGLFRRIDSEDYPIRKMKYNEYNIYCIIQDLKDNILSQSEIEEKYHIKSYCRLYNINTGLVGKKWFPQEHYPIREGIVNRKPVYLSSD